MKFSIYNYVVKNNEDFIIFNTVSGAVVCVDPSFLNNLKNDTCPKEQSVVLYNMGILVDDNCNELERVLTKNKENIEKQDNKIYTICPTTCCNAKCFYCFENNRKHFVMTKEIADATVNFIEQDVLNSNAKNICLSWFGGEPLLNQDIMGYITNKILTNKKLTEKININAKITTNGILIDNNVIENFKTWKIDTVQITLDGYGEEYEKRKAYVNEKNAFEKIIDIIQQLSNNRIYVSIRLNYDHNNFNSILKLVDYLCQKFTEQQKQYIKVYPAKLEDNQACSICNTNADINYFKILTKLKNGNLAKSFKQLNLKYRFAHCLAESEYNYVIGANGNLYKCNEKVDDETCKVGDVFTGVNIAIKNRELSGECKECKFLPICQGGCPIRANKSGSSSKCQLEKFIIADILRLYIN
ncbi:MAG: SPASM domain-containing protein [Clostridiales bacterium]|nr:SPASM domain-containing protein [Clostridiales bacterium]